MKDLFSIFPKGRTEPRDKHSTQQAAVQQYKVLLISIASSQYTFPSSEKKQRNVTLLISVLSVPSPTSTASPPLPATDALTLREEPNNLVH